MEREWKCRTKINTTINHVRRVTRAWTNDGLVTEMGTDGDGEENRISVNHLQQE